MRVLKNPWRSCAAALWENKFVKRIDYSDWKKRKRLMFDRLVALENSFEGRAVGRRPRDPDKEKILIEMDRNRRRQYMESGKLEMVGPRRWKWRVDFR